MAIRTTWRSYVTFVLLYLQCHNVIASRQVVMAGIKEGKEHHRDLINLSSDWEALGPFQIGTRGVISSVRVSR